jgi:nucleotide-binding universal stress UspA family protein
MRFQPKKILVPTDFSLHSDRAVSAAIELAQPFGATVTLLHVVPMSDYATYAARLAPGSSEFDRLQSSLHEAATKSIAAEVARLSSKLELSGDTVDGPPPAEICAYAKEHGFDLIVIGSHGLSGFKHLLLGSVAERVVHHATVPVLVVRDAQ